MTGRHAVFLDRDGTILVEKEYLADPRQAELIPGAAEGLRRLAEAGFALVVVTNQSGIARGMYRVADYEAVDARMRELLGQHGVRIEASYYCPHHPDFNGVCQCRKPGSALFRQAVRELGLDARASWLVGDRLRDLEPASSLAARGSVLVRTGYGTDEARTAPSAVVVADDLSGAADAILRAESTSRGTPPSA